MPHQVVLETQHGCRLLEGGPDDTVATVLHLAGVPLSAVWTYIRDDEYVEAGSAPVRFVPASTRLGESHGVVRARANRNVDLVGLSRLAPSAAQGKAAPTTEWTFPGIGGGAYDRTEAMLSQEDCVSIVREAACRVLDAWPPDMARRLVVGISGGGDSNVLLTALVESERIALSDVVPVIVLGPDMEQHLRMARELCGELDCPLTAIDDDEAARLAGIHSVRDYFFAFERHYPDADIDFAWTWLLRRALAGAARERGVGVVAIGANREDLLSEGFLRLARGLAPMPAPYRRIGTEVFVYPMCEVPKKIGDGAYPRRSLDNYETRTQSVAAGRSAFYQLAYLLADHLPGMDMTLLAGFNQLGTETAAQQDPIVLDSEIHDHIADRMSDPEQRERWKALLAEVQTG
jgi:tRNA(Ile)-lysidine synthase TilS/MesJ